MERFNPATYIVIDRITGEEVPVDIFVEKVSSDYWEKAYAKTLAEYIGVGGTASCKVLAYLIKEKDSENRIFGTLREIAEKTQTTAPHVNTLIKKLISKNYLVKIRNGLYMLSPKIMVYGSNTRGAMILRIWEQETNVKKFVSKKAS